MKRDRTSDPAEATTEHLTAEVGSEGGGPGDVEIARAYVPSSGSEATETMIPGATPTRDVGRDQTGQGRRTP